MFPELDKHMLVVVSDVYVTELGVIVNDFLINGDYVTLRADSVSKVRKKKTE